MHCPFISFGGSLFSVHNRAGEQAHVLVTTTEAARMKTLCIKIKTDTNWLSTEGGMGLSGVGEAVRMAKIHHMKFTENPINTNNNKIEHTCAHIQTLIAHNK